MNKTKSKTAKELLSKKGRKYDCKECGKQMSNINAHIRAAHEGISCLIPIQNMYGWVAWR